jgi:hypothetical protein
MLPPVVEDENNNLEIEVLPQEPVQDQEMRQNFQDTSYLPFPHRNRRPQQTDEQFGQFIEVI